MIRAHVTAITTLLAGLPSTCKVHLADVDGALDGVNAAPPPSTPYVVLRTDSAPLTSDRLTQWSNRLDMRLYVTCVGATMREAQWAQEKTRALLVDVVPTVTGRTCGPLTMADSSPVTTDHDVTPPLLVVVDVYRLLSLAA